MTKKGTQIPYDKIMFASGYVKGKMPKNYSNVITIEDYDSHAWAHNMILRSDNIVVFGDGFEAL